tara:strand:+ start:464 stop:883 length:420 start_codon:yes stop_codon:yes gene_type:complete
MGEFTRFIPATILIVLGVLALIGAQGGVFEISCTGFNAINPLCWTVKILDIGIELLAIVVGVIFVVAGIMLMLLVDEDQRKWFLPFLVIGMLTAVNWIVPDPLPIIDEILMTLVTGYFGVKTIVPDSEPVKKITEGGEF